ncbi:DUF6894 family protein [Bradyrhizobium sp. CCBAU 11357]|uniref:DUF6894 family protein n=1 Tax=Bradyrhizobium sp. CCBAU 11357 TaxID=1630808 RepID=UPI0023048BAC|nr:hypothetical protein [Bradyrhizobium sp. CCBAU 11357]
MPRYYFDYRDDIGLWTDDSGEELSSLEAAEKAALVALADAGRDMALAGRQGCVSIQVRDDSGFLLQGTIVLKTAANYRAVPKGAELFLDTPVIGDPQPNPLTLRPDWSSKSLKRVSGSK